jgi:hypothetical protein
MARTGLEVYGIKDTLKQLNKLAPDLRREITRDYKRITMPMVEAARTATPGAPPLSGMYRKWRRGGPWYGAAVDKKINVKIDTRRARKKNLQKGAQYETLGAFVFQSNETWGQIFDMAGRNQAKDGTVQKRVYGGKEYRYTWNNTLIQNLNINWGRASRYMYPTAESYESILEHEIQGLVWKTERLLAEAIARSEGK